jgi:uncharacterized repeat protein (TIGR04138 family)
MGRPRPFGVEGEAEASSDEPPPESHLTGQQLCEAIRLYASELYGLMAKVVLNSWGLRTTSDFGEIVYSLIELGEMTKSDSDRPEDFENVYDFDEAFRARYEIDMPDEAGS